MTRRKKLIILLLIILAIILLAYVVYWIFKPEARPWYPRENLNANINQGVLPNINEAVNRPPANLNAAGILPGISQVANGDKTLVEPVVTKTTKDTFLTKDGKTMVFYDQDSGQFYKMVPGAEPQLLTSDIYKAAENVTFSPNGDKAIIEFPDGSNIMYDFNRDKQYSLPKEMEDFTFSPTGERIAFKYLGPDEFEKWYAISNPDGTQLDPVDLLGDNADKVDMDWSPQGQIIGNWWEAQAGVKLEIKFLGANRENLASTIVEGIGFNSQWSPDGNKLLYSVANQESDLKPELWIVDAAPATIGQARTALKVNTWADKCTFSSSGSTVYCAVPQNLDFGAGIAREVADDNVDQIVKIDLRNNSSQTLAIPVDQGGNNIYTIDRLFVDQGGNYLYFVDKDNSNIHKILLK